MDKHCKGCTHHHNAGHAKSAKNMVKFNDWCSKHGYPAKDSIGWCKLNNAKTDNNHAQ